MPFFGELYLRTTRPLLPAEVTEQEVRYLYEAFSRTAAGGILLDVGCGHGRHLSGLLEHGLGVVGLELDVPSLVELPPRARASAVRGDFRHLPFQSAAFAGAYAWYSTLFIDTDQIHAAILAELARVIRGGGKLILQTVPYERLLAEPRASFRAELPGGAWVEESSCFDPITGRDTGTRVLHTKGGDILSGEYCIRYYPLPELRRLLESVGFTVAWVHGDLEGGALGESSAELIVGAVRTHG